MVTREKVKSEFQRKNSSLRIRLCYNFPDITGHHRKLGMRRRDWKLGLPNWHRLGVRKRGKRGEERKERGKRDQRGKADGQ